MRDLQAIYPARIGTVYETAATSEMVVSRRCYVSIVAIRGVSGPGFSLSIPTQMSVGPTRLDVAHGEPAAVEREDLVVEPLEAALVLADDLG